MAGVYDSKQYVNPDTDGKFYDLNSLVKIGCNDCEGCFLCCQGMGSSIVLDPYDMFMLKKALPMNLQELLGKQYLELGIYDGMIIPHMKMSGIKNQCSFVNEKGRCSIHKYRPGICRLFPLGRNFKDGEMNYIFLDKACPKNNGSKIKVEKWLGISNISAYHNYIVAWHDFRKEMAQKFGEADPQEAREFAMYILHTFYGEWPEEEASFYECFTKKINKVKKAFG